MNRKGKDRNAFERLAVTVMWAGVGATLALMILGPPSVALGAMGVCVVACVLNLNLKELYNNDEYTRKPGLYKKFCRRFFGCRLGAHDYGQFKYGANECVECGKSHFRWIETSE